MKTNSVILGVVVSVILLATAAILYVSSGSGGEQRYRASINLVREIQQLSSGWSVEIARVKADPFADFDALTAFVPRMKQLKGDLSRSAREISDLPDRIGNDLRAYVNAIDAKEERIERFKTSYAVVRNSARYLPLATASVTQLAWDAKNEPLARAISSLVQDMNLYLASPTDAAKERLTGEVARLREASLTYPLPLTNALANLFAHAEVLLDRQKPMEELFHQATSNDISDLTDKLADNLQFELGRKEIRSVYYERGILGIIVFLGLFWIGLAFRQRSQSRAAAEARSGPGAVQLGPAPLARIAAPQVPPLEERRAAPEISAPTAAPPEPADPPYATEVIPLPAAFEESLSPAAFADELPADGESQPAREESIFADGDTDSWFAGAPSSTARPASEPSEEFTVQQGFLADCVATSLTASTARIAAGIDRLRMIQNRIRGALQDNDALLEMYDGADLEEEMEAATAVAASVRREANAIADVAKRLASSSGTSDRDGSHDMIDVNACIDEVLEITGAESAATIAKRLGNLPEIFASRADIRLLIEKIIENSVHAVAGLNDRNGTIKIDTARKNDEILITIIDNGVGIPSDRRAKIFRPFYTSRDGAMGLGLPLASHLVKKYEGAIKLNSLPGQGTVTRITLPAGLPSHGAATA